MQEDQRRPLTEKEKSFLGLPYNALGQELMKGRLRARKYLKAYNDYPPAQYYDGMKPEDQFGPDERFQILADLFDIPLEQAKKLAIEPPFYCDYGTNIHFSGDFYANFNFTVLDCNKVNIGSRVLCGPNVQLYAATHSVEVAERQAGLERAYPITIGDDVWIGGNTVIVGPCKIGNGCTVAAGAVVKGDFPDNVVIGGVPAKIIKYLDNTATSNSQPAAQTQQ